jgi:hypothetical protein
VSICEFAERLQGEDNRAVFVTDGLFVESRAAAGIYLDLTPGIWSDALGVPRKSH